jgi:hypothetical protein
MPGPQPGMALVHPLTQPMIQPMMPPPMMPQMASLHYPMMQQPAAGGYWPAQTAVQPGFASGAMPAGVSGLQNPSVPHQGSAPAGQPRAHNVSPILSPVHSASVGATARRVRFEDGEANLNGTSESINTSTPAIVIDDHGKTKLSIKSFSSSSI